MTRLDPGSYVIDDDLVAMRPYNLSLDPNGTIDNIKYAMEHGKFYGYTDDQGSMIILGHKPEYADDDLDDDDELDGYTFEVKV